MNRSAFSGTSRLRRGRTGTSLLEAMVALFVTGLVTTAAMALVAQIGRTYTRVNSTNTRTVTANVTTGEVMYELRQASALLPSITLSGQKVLSSSTRLIVSAPGYNSADSAYILRNVSDTIIFSYDATASTITQTTVLGQGSERPSRSGFVLAKNVENAEFRYIAQEVVTASGTNYTLTAAPKFGASVQAFVNGTRVNCSHSTTGTESQRSTVTLQTAPAANADVQFTYEITQPEEPANNPSTREQKWEIWTKLVTQVDYVVTLREKQSDGNVKLTAVTIPGSVRFRNYR